MARREGVAVRQSSSFQFRAHVLSQRPACAAADLDGRLRILLGHVLPPKAGGLIIVGKFQSGVEFPYSAIQRWPMLEA